MGMDASTLSHDVAAILSAAKEHGTQLTGDQIVKLAIELKSSGEGLSFAKTLLEKLPEMLAPKPGTFGSGAMGIAGLGGLGSYGGDGAK